MATTTTPAWNPATGLNSYPAISAVPATIGTPATSTAAPMTATTSNAATRSVDNNELMSNQLTGLLNKDSPLMQQAAGAAKNAANSRGLLNTSMAVQAGQAAVMDRAMPIAQYDAGVNTNVLNSNTANTQQTNMFNAGNQQDANKFNASTTTQNNQFNADNINKAKAADVGETNKLIAQMVDTQTKTQLADTEAQYKTLMQASSSAQNMYQQSVKNISEIMMNPDLTPVAKSAAVTNQNKLLETGMKIVGSMNNLNLDKLLVFPDAATTQATGLTLSGDIVNDGKQLALLTGITTAADITALSALPTGTQSAINDAIQTNNKSALIGAISGTELTQAAKDKLLASIK